MDFRPGLRPATGLLVLVLLLLPLGLPLLAEHNCACGMRSACFCELTARTGAHCDRSGSCSMRPTAPSSPMPLVASLDLRGWLAPAVLGVAPCPEPAGASAEALCRIPRAVSPLPQVPPPRPSRLG